MIRYLTWLRGSENRKKNKNKNKKLNRTFESVPEMKEGQSRSAQSAILGLAMVGASAPTSLQKFQASKPTLTSELFIPGSPSADTYFSDPPPRDSTYDTWLSTSIAETTA